MVLGRMSSDYDDWEKSAHQRIPLAAIKAVAGKLGIGSAETLRKWVRQDEVDAGKRPGVTREESAEMRRLKQENAELRRANEILKAASAYFARELDPRLPR